MNLPIPQSAPLVSVENDDKSDPIKDQRRRHKALSTSKKINAILSKYMAIPRPFNLREESDTAAVELCKADKPVDPRLRGEYSMKSANVFQRLRYYDFRGDDVNKHVFITNKEVELAVSPFPNRRPTLWLTPYDRPWDGDPCFGKSYHYLRPTPLPIPSEEAVHGGNSLSFSTHRAGYVQGNDDIQSKGCEERVEGADFSQKTIGSRNSPIVQPFLGNPNIDCNDQVPMHYYVLGVGTTPFSGLVSTLDCAGFLLMPPRRSLLDCSWSLKWAKSYLKSDYKAVRAGSFQKMNHIPGCYPLGRKHMLHFSLLAAEERWKRYVEARNGAKSASSLQTGEDKTRNYRSFGEGLSPRSWILPEEDAACRAALRHPQHLGRLFIVKPAFSACGRGIHLVKGGPNADIRRPQSTRVLDPKDEVRKGDRQGTPFSSFSPIVETLARQGPPPERFVVQEYIADPYLVYGYKFDLRLYVVLTSYEPVRMYLYKEGLVRFATSPYYESPAPLERPNLAGDLSGEGSTRTPALKSEEEGSLCIADEGCLTAHLTNFTINKKSEDFVIPCDSGQGSADKSSAGDGFMVSKWSLAALRAYMEEDGVDWEATMERVEDLLAKVFLSIVPNVRAELRGLDSNRNGGAHDIKKAAFTKAKATNQNSDLPAETPSLFSSKIPPPPFTVRGVSPFFEIFGVDVLLRRSSSKSDHTLDISISEEEGKRQCKPQSTSGVVLNPVIIEANIMPSLSTHYSPLDQCIKGNFIADALNLVGLSPIGFKPSRTPSFPSPDTTGTNSKAPHTKPFPDMHDNASESISKHPKEKEKGGELLGCASSTEKKEITGESHAIQDTFSTSHEREDGEYVYNYLLKHLLYGQPSFVVDACMVSEEERLRSLHFRRLLPTSRSFSLYEPLLVSKKDDSLTDQSEGQGNTDKFLDSTDLKTDAGNSKVKEDEACDVHPWQSLDEVLSAWEACRERLVKSAIKKGEI